MRKGCALAAVALLALMGIPFLSQLELRRVVGDSMAPSFRHADVVVISAPRIPIRAGMVVIFEIPNRTSGPEEGVKRVSAVEGDRLEYRAGVFLRNDSVLISSDAMADVGPWHLQHVTDEARTRRPTRESWGPITIPVDSLFVLGDNLEQSADSRDFGLVSEASVTGCVRASVPFGRLVSRLRGADR